MSKEKGKGQAEPAKATLSGERERSTIPSADGSNFLTLGETPGRSVQIQNRYAVLKMKTIFPALKHIKAFFLGGVHDHARCNLPSSD